MTASGLAELKRVVQMLDLPETFLRGELRRRNLRGIKLSAGWRFALADVRAYADGARYAQFNASDLVVDGLSLGCVNAAAGYLTVQQVAKIIRTSERFVFDELRRRNLRGAKLGAGWRIDHADLMRYMEARMNVSRVRGHRAN